MTKSYTHLARVALPVPLQESFVYGVPSGMEDEVRPGCQVLVPFRSRSLRGFVLEVFDGEPPKGLRQIESLKGGPVDGGVMRLAKWAADYYVAPLGEVLKAAVPNPVARPRLQDRAEVTSTVPERGLSLKPTSHQAAVLEAVAAGLEGRAFQVFLLQGVTGSGKTFVYCKAAAEVIASGGSCLVLVPEISMSTQLVDRFRDFFGDEVAISHSGLSASERYMSWKKAGSGEAKVIVGARSAVFSPLKNLRLIVVDEEHEPSYKQSDVPRYNARDVAVKRGQMEDCLVLLGTATPSLESYNNARTGKYRMLRLPCRIDSRPLASVQIVDLKSPSEEEKAAAREAGWLFSKTLREKMKERLANGEQVILFINRRGHSTFVQCRDCGGSFRCPRCAVTLTYHSDPHRLFCHYCGHSSGSVNQCPNCTGSNFWFGGVGTQKVENEIKRMFPEAGVLRMDVDSTRRRGSQRSMVEKFSSGKALVLLGTQMVAKGLDFPGVTLVGVIYADTQLNLPDFRASERTFQLLTQVAGRAGRGERPGEVIIQTFLPDHPSLRAAARQDFELFCKGELKDRRELFFPPFSRLIDVSFAAADEDEVVQCSTRVKRGMEEWLRGEGIVSVDVMGPAPYPVARVRNRSRWHITLRGRSLPELRASLEALRGIAESERPGRMAVGLDVDPLQLM
jgi:primosomal protein N' (replication factor Y)